MAKGYICATASVVSIIIKSFHIREGIENIEIGNPIFLAINTYHIMLCECGCHWAAKNV